MVTLVASQPHFGGEATVTKGAVNRFLPFVVLSHVNFPVEKEREPLVAVVATEAFALCTLMDSGMLCQFRIRFEG